MLQKLLTLIEFANFKSAVRQGRLACPACGGGPGVISSPAADDVIVCAKCGTAASALEWSARASAQKLIGKADEPPASTKITREGDPSGTISWRIPASGKSGGMMFFAAFWCGITAVISGGFLFAKKGPEGALAVGIVLFFALFWAIGLGMAYAACRNKYARHRLTVDRDRITLRRELFGRDTEQRLSTSTVESIAAVEFYQSNYQPVHGIEIRAPRGKLRFGSMLTEEEKAWLVADLKRAVFGPAPENEAVVPLRSPGTGRGDFISVRLPLAPGQWLGAGIMFLVIGVAFILVGVFVMDQSFMEERRPRAQDGAIGSMFNFLFSSFRVMWIAQAGVFAAIGVGMLIRYSRRRGQETRLEGTKDEIVLRTTKAGRLVSQRDFPKGTLLDVRASFTGSSNGKPMKRIELLIGAKAHTLGRWFDGEKADSFVAEARRALFA